MKKISIVSTCLNESENIFDFYNKVTAVLNKLNRYDYEIIIADNCSTDGTIQKLKEICDKDKKFKVILNNRNYGADKSMFNALIQATGDFIILLHIDLETSENVINEFLKKSEEDKNNKYIVGQIIESDESFFIKNIRRLFYYFYNKFSYTPLIFNESLTLLDKTNLQLLKKISDPEPFNRGLFAELFGSPQIIKMKKEKRKKGKSKNSFFNLYSLGITGLVKSSTFPMRFMTFFGLIFSFIFFLISIYYLISKLLFWNQYEFGVAPALIILCFISSFLLFSLGIIGEYIVSILNYKKNIPVIEKEKINF